MKILLCIWSRESGEGKREGREEEEEENRAEWKEGKKEGLDRTGQGEGLQQSFSELSCWIQHNTPKKREKRTGKREGLKKRGGRGKKNGRSSAGAE